MVHEVKGRPTEVGKLWKKPNPQKPGEVKAYELRAEKLRILLDGEPTLHNAINSVVGLAWPKATLSDDAGATVGFVMPRAPRNTRFRELVNYCVPEARQRIKKSGGSRFSRTDLLTTAQNVALLFDHLHRFGYVIGDVNHTNILANNKGRVYLIDIDSIQVKDPKSGIVYRCEVGKDDFTPPRLAAQKFSDVDRTVDDDLFGLAVIVFHLLMGGCHPYDTLERAAPGRQARKGNIRLENIRKSHSPIARLDTGQAREWLDLAGIPDANLRREEEARFLKRVKGKATVDFERLLTDRATLWLELEPELRDLFVQAFGDGPGGRPEARQWAGALSAAGARKPVPAQAGGAAQPSNTSRGLARASSKRAVRPVASPALAGGGGTRTPARPYATPAWVTGSQPGGAGTAGGGGVNRPGVAAVNGHTAPNWTVNPPVNSPHAHPIPAGGAAGRPGDILSQMASWTIVFVVALALVGISSLCYLDLAYKEDFSRSGGGRNLGPCEELQAGAVLGKCDFSGRDLRGLDLTGVELQHSDLRFANLEGSVLAYANLSNTDLAGATLGKVSLHGASLAGANVEGVDLSGVDLYSTDISGIESFDNADLRNTVFPQEADLSGVSFRGADLSESWLKKTDLTKADFTGAKLYRSDFGEADLRKASFKEASMRKARFIGAKLRGADITEADAQGAGFYWADVGKVDFGKTDLTEASFANAKVAGADFTGANLTDAYFGQTTGTGRAVFEDTMCSDGARSDDCYSEGRLMGVNP